MKKLLLSLSGILLAASAIAQQNENIVEQTGNIGIGTLNPSARMEVNGNAIIDSSLTVKEELIVDNDAHINSELIVEGGAIMRQASTAEDNLEVRGNLILPNLIDITDMSNHNIMTVNGDGVTAKTGIENLVGVFYQEKQCSGSLLDNPYWMNGYEKLFSRCPEVKVGIGTSTPLYSLDTRGTGYFSEGIKVGGNTSPSIPAYIEGYGSLAVAKPWLRFTINEAGLDKTAFLVEKNGGVYCTSVRVRLSEDIPVPDFVFKKDYKLMPLSEVKKYVKTNSHLPNIPSEDKIREEGLSIEEMQLKLLQKIEELTLYVIEIEEENKELAKQVKELQNK